MDIVFCHPCPCTLRRADREKRNGYSSQERTSHKQYDAALCGVDGEGISKEEIDH